LCSLELPDIESRFWKPYKDKGLVAAAIDANGDDPAGLKLFVDYKHVTYDVGLEDPTTKTYAAVTENYKGLNPFPVDIVVGRDGNVAYIAREYDPPTLQLVIERELAK
jgi:hypothetical protein